MIVTKSKALNISSYLSATLSCLLRVNMTNAKHIIKRKSNFRKNWNKLTPRQKVGYVTALVVTPFVLAGAGFAINHGFKKYMT